MEENNKPEEDTYRERDNVLEKEEKSLENELNEDNSREGSKSF